MSELDLTALRAKLADVRGRTYWRSLEELADTPAFQDLLRREFPSQASEWIEPVGRRQFLRLMGASLALAGVGACTTQPREEIVPYVRAPESVVPGKPLYFATAMPLAGTASGLLVESHMGRPTKVEGNPLHPASLGAADAYAQASILTLYDPDRSQSLTQLGDVRPWGELFGTLQAAMTAQRAAGGAGLRILTQTVSSPSLADHLRSLLAELPEARWHQYEPVNRTAAWTAARLAFGRVVDTHYRLDEARVILSLDADFMSCGAGHLRYAREVSRRRRVESGSGEDVRLYVVESSPSVTGAAADHRLSLRASEVEAFGRALADALGIEGLRSTAADAAVLPAEVRETWLPALVRDLRRHPGRTAIVPGEYQSAAVHGLAHAINAALGNAGETVIHTEPVAAEPMNQTESLATLVRDMQAGRVELLLILGGNPVVMAPADLPFAEAMEQVALRVHLGLYDDETSERCHWHVPEAHFLESWGDTRSHDGTVTFLQPMIEPLYGGRTTHDLLAALSTTPDRTSYEIVRDFWRRAFEAEAGDWGPLTDPDGQPYASFEAFWRRSLHDGVVAGSARSPLDVTPEALPARGAGTGDSGLELIFRPDPGVYDGRFANNGWLQELPKPLTKLTWENAALVGPATADRLGLQSGDIVELRHRDRVVEAPVLVQPGHPAEAVTVHLGYGRRRAGRVGNGAGFDAYALRTSDAPWHAAGLEVRATGARVALATTQLHHDMEGRHLVRAGTREQYERDPGFVHALGHTPADDLTLYPAREPEGHQWGMAIDLGACIGCNACVVACQAENNIPVVGREQVLAQREMHWLRIDRYYEGSPDQPATYHQPVPCMHCENAPCEVVCPVAATVHSAEGLNDMVYNRCVGTRYCSNNCPYKVRRFNFLLYADFETPSLQLARNPDVTVRSRGVMEKCTYCVQRINKVRIEAEKNGRPIVDGEIVTACEATCPAEAIVFGDVNDPESRVSRLKATERSYGLLEEVNTRPRTTYLAALRNPNPEIEPSGSADPEPTHE